MVVPLWCWKPLAGLIESAEGNALYGSWFTLSQVVVARCYCAISLLKVIVMLILLSCLRGLRLRKGMPVATKEVFHFTSMKVVFQYRSQVDVFAEGLLEGP